MTESRRSVSPRVLAHVLVASGVLAVAPPLAHARAIQARVVDASTGDPVAGATVLLEVRTDKGLIPEPETETDADGRFALDRPDGKLVLFVYKAGYVVWSNEMMLKLPRGQPIGRAAVPDATPSDGTIPEPIRLTPFPPDGWRPTHAVYLWLIANADGRYAQRPRFWQAIQWEREAALKQCGKDCD